MILIQNPQATLISMQSKLKHAIFNSHMASVKQVCWTDNHHVTYSLLCGLQSNHLIYFLKYT